MSSFPVSILSVLALSALGADGALNVRTDSATKKTSTDVYYATRMADRFAAFTSRHRRSVDSFHLAEQNRLQSALEGAASTADRSLLEVAATMNEESRLEAQNAFNEMMHFVTTLKSAMGATGSATSCVDLTCGSKAVCVMYTNNTAGCECQAGYQGNGFVCNVPVIFATENLFSIAANQQQPQVADLHVTTLRGGNVAVAYRDVSRFHQGYVMIGKAGPHQIKWGTPMLFSNQSQAFSPVLVELQDSPGVAIVYRDQNKGGSGIVVGAGYDPHTNSLTLGKSKAFARHQAQQMSVVALPQSRVAVMYAEHVLTGTGKAVAGGAMYGAALLAKVHADGSAAPEVSWKRRFTSGPVARLTTTMLSPSSFVMAYRGGETSPTAERSEAACMFVKTHGSGLVFDTHPLQLEPDQTQIWARSLSMIHNNTFAYTYHSGNEGVTKQAVLRADPTTHSLSMLQKPTVIAHGFAPFVGTVGTSTPLLEQQPEQLALLQRQGPRMFTYFNKDGGNYAHARICKVSDDGLPHSCQEMPWSNRQLLSVSSTPIGDGRVVFVSTDAKGHAHYQFVGLMEPDLVGSEL